MPFRIPTNRVDLLRVLSAKADVSQLKAAAVWDALLALARDGVRQSGSFSFPGLGKLERIERAPRRAFNLATRKCVRLAPKTDLIFRVSKLAKAAMLPPAEAPAKAKAAAPAKAKAAAPAKATKKLTKPAKPAARRRR